jgi:hypothetical protein
MSLDVLHVAASDRRARWFVAFHLVMSLAPVVFCVTWGIRETHTLAVSEIGNSGGYAYAVTLGPSAYSPYFEVEGDTLRDPRARTRLYENARRLGPAHRPGDAIREDGDGQFSHLGSTLYFSTSDNGDPQVNGRTYTVVTAATLPIRVLGVWAFIFAASAFLVFWRAADPIPIALALPRAWKFSGAVLIVGLFFAVVIYSIDPEPWGSIRAGLALWAFALLTSAVLAWRSGGEAARFGPALWDDLRKSAGDLIEKLDRPFARPGWQGGIWRAVSLSIPFVVFAVLVREPLPAGVLIDSYYFVAPIAIPLGLVLWLCHRRQEWVGVVASLTMTLALFALPLAALWQHFATNAGAVGGLLPFADANGYYYDARRLLHGHGLGWSARRPLFPAFLGLLLAITRENLQVTIAALVALNAVATFLLARALRATHGAAAAAIATVVLFLFYRGDGAEGILLSENLGLAMGCLGFAVLWRGATRASVRAVCLGVFVLTVALMARAGAFFVLPALVLAVPFAFRGDRRWVRFGAGGVAGVAIAAALTVGVGRLLSDPAGGHTIFSNFSYSLYGLVVGGKGWTQVQRDHPNAAEGAEIYSLAWQAFRANPMGIVQGSVRMWREYFRLRGPFHAFAFVQDLRRARSFQILCYAFAAIGLAGSVRRHREPPHLLILAALLGHLGSIPFVPPIDAGPRAYAATIPILAILTSLGPAHVVEWIRQLRGMPPLLASSRTAPAVEVLAVSFAAVVFVGPLAVFYLARAPVLREKPCQEGATPVWVHVPSGSLLRIIGPVPDVNDTPMVVPEIRQRDMQRSAEGVELKNEAKEFSAGRTMVNTYDLKTGRYVWLVGPTSLVSESRDVVQICGRDSPDGLSRPYGVFYALESR